MDIARQVSAVMLVFALLGAALWTLRRGGRLRIPGGLRPAGRGRALESVERLALTPQHSLHLVKIGGREVVVATNPQGCALLTARSQLGAGE
jgi:flagellar biogenesis protein FliO